MDKWDEATVEVAKTARDLGGFIARYVGGPLGQACGIVEDKLKYMRWERQIRLMQRAEEFLAERRLDKPTRAVPLPFIIPLLQAGSLEEDDSLQDRWALLLVNAADADSQTEARKAFISILEDLTPLDALILEKIYSLPCGNEPDADIYPEIHTTFLPDRVTFEVPEQDKERPPLDCEVSLGNLARLGLISAVKTWGGMTSFKIVYRTRLGWEFIRAVSRPAYSPL